MAWGPGRQRTDQEGVCEEAEPGGRCSNSLWNLKLLFWITDVISLCFRKGEYRYMDCTCSGQLVLEAPQASCVHRLGAVLLMSIPERHRSQRTC